MTAQYLHSRTYKTMQIGKYTCRLGILQIKQMLDGIYHPEHFDYLILLVTLLYVVNDQVGDFVYMWIRAKRASCN